MADCCRCCLADVSCMDISKYFSLDDPIICETDQVNFDGKSYRQLFEEYAGFQVKAGEPDNICISCKSRLLDGWSFWKLIKKTQNLLHINTPDKNVADQREQEKEERLLVENTKDILAYLAEDLNLSGECKDIVDTLPPLTLDLELEALIGGNSPHCLESISDSPKKHICPFSPNKMYKNIDHHLSRKHRDLKTIKCTTMGCRRTFYTIEMLSDHLLKDCGHRRSMVSNQKNKTLTFLCKFCGRKFNDYQKVRSHENAHRKKIKAAQDGPRYKCDICKKLFMEKKNVRLHIESVHLRLKKLQCQECDLKFYSDSGFRYHMKTAHKMQETLKCSLCNYETKINFLMKRHLKRHDNPDSLVNHNTKNSKDENCPFCLSKFKTSKLLSKHLQTSHGSNNKIIFCKTPANNLKNTKQEKQDIQEQGEILAELNSDRQLFY